MMKRIILLCSLICCLICAKADMYDQQYFGKAQTIQLEKPGTLAKVIGKDVESVTCLQIKGELSDKDMKALSKLTNLKRLSIRYANIGNTKSFPLLPNLEVLFLPDNQLLPVEYLDQVPANANLKVLMLCSFKYYSLTGGDRWGQNQQYNDISFAPFASLQKVILSNNLGLQKIDNKVHGKYTKEPIIVDTLIYECNNAINMFETRRYKGIEGHLFYIGTDDVDFSQIQAVRKPIITDLYDERVYWDNRNLLKLKPSIPKNLNLQNMTYIGKDYFNDSDVESITFSSTSLQIEDGAFENARKLKSIIFAKSISSIVIAPNTFANCPNLETVIFDCPVAISANAFKESNNIQKIIFNASATIQPRAFYKEHIYDGKPSVKEIICNAPVIIKEDAFSIVERATFNIMPNSLNSGFATCKALSIPKEKGALDKFIAWGFSTECLIDPSANLTFDIIVTEPGNILKFLPIDKLTQIKSLTITGHLYDSDIAIIKQCTNLQYLNLANTYISESPSTQERRQAENEMWTAFAELSVADAQVKQATGELKKREAKQLATEAVLAAAMMQAQNPEMPDCYIPASAFANMLCLSEVVLPIMVKKVNGRAFKDCSALQKIDLGNALEEIGKEAFANTQLTNIKFPETLKSIHVEALENIETLNVLDFSKSTMETTYGMIYDYYINYKIGRVKNVHTLYMPKGMKELNFLVSDDSSYMNVKDLYVGKDVNNINRDVKNVNLHFQTELAPEFGWFGKVTNCTIFVPKNANITSYYAKFNGNGNKIIQE